MNRFAGLAIFAVGVVLLVLGVSASDSVGSDISRFFNGTPTDKAVWLILGGVVAVVVGSGALFFSGRRPARG